MAFFRKSTCVGVNVFVVLLLVAGSAQAHRLEPISTEFARPFAPRTGSLETTYEYDRGRDGERIHLVPELEFELGFYRRMQFSIELPLILDSSVGASRRFGGGNAEFGFRYLLFGGDRNNFAVSLNPFVAPPISRSELAEDATEAGIGLHVDREFGGRAFFHGNYGWATTIGGDEERERVFFHRSALVFPVTERWNPTVEFLGQTDTATGVTGLFLQPELIYYINRHWELKVGVPVGLSDSSSRVGLRAQVAWIFGRRGSD